MNEYPSPGHYTPLTGPAAHAEFAALVKIEQAKIDGAKQEQAGNSQSFDAEMRAAGIQRTDVPPTGEVDQRAVAYLQTWRREHPGASPPQLALYEKDLSEVLAGRRLNESTTAFAQRMKGGEPAAPATEQKTDAAADIGLQLPAGVIADDAEGLNRVLGSAEKLGIAESTVNEILQSAAQTALQDDPLPSAFTGEAFQLFDYSISPADIGDGFELDRNSHELYAVCRAAREKGISQEALIQMMKSYFMSDDKGG